MSYLDFLNEHHVVQAVTSTEQPKGEDMFEGNITSDIVNMSGWRGMLVTVTKLAGAVGTATFTAYSCDTAVPGTATAIAFRERHSTTPDTYTAWADIASTGKAITAGADETWEFFIDSRDLVDGDEYARFILTETESTAVDGGVHVMLIGPRHGVSIPDTVLV